MTSHPLSHISGFANAHLVNAAWRSLGHGTAIGNVVIGIIDDGFEYDHPMMGGALSQKHSVDHIDGDASSLLANDSRHGQAVAGVIAGVGSGLDPFAPGVTIAGHRVSFGSAGSVYDFADALRAQADLDVSNNSWSFTTLFGDNFNANSYATFGWAIEHAAKQGRDGLGTALVFAAGNARRSGDDVNYHNLKNSEYVISVGAVDANGRAADFSAPGAAVLISANGVSVRTTDLTGGKGYASGDTVHVSGTSFAAPAVSGVVARLYAANPGLGYRDVQEILALSAVPTEIGGSEWQENGAQTWNGGGLFFSHRKGFGVVDGDAAVRLATSWSASSTAHNREIASYSQSYGNSKAIPDTGAAVKAYFDVTQAVEIDRVAVTLDIDHSRRGDLVVTLVSPGGTESVLINRPGLDPKSSSGLGDYGNDIRFETTSVAHLGEDARGRWTLRVEDHAPGTAGKLYGATLRIIGDPASDDDMHVFTDSYSELADPARATLHDTGGHDVLNLAALSKAAHVDLAERKAQIDGRDLVISSQTIIETVQGGAGDDSLAGSQRAETLLGGAGSDALRGAGGADVLAGGLGADALDGGAGEDVAVYSGKRADFAITALDAATLGIAVASMVAGMSDDDTLTKVETLVFDDMNVDVRSLFPAIAPPEAPEDPPRSIAGADALAGLLVWLTAAAEGVGDQSRLTDGSGLAHDATAMHWGARAKNDDGLVFDGSDGYAIANAPDLNAGGPYGGRTIALSVTASSGGDTRQVLYEQGGASRGLSVYRDGGDVVMTAWNLPEEGWGPVSVRAALPIEQAVSLALVFDAHAGTLTGWLDGEAFGAIGVGGPLHEHTGGIGIGSVNGEARAADGSILKGGFVGRLHELAAYDRALGPGEIAALSDVWAGKEPDATTSPGDPGPALHDLPQLAVWLDAGADLLDADGDGTAETWRDLSGSGNDAQAAMGAVAIENGRAVFGGTDGFVFADDAALNTAYRCDAKTVTIAFQADATGGHQVLYEQGGSLRGLLMGIEAGQLVWRAWNLAEDRWEVQTSVALEEGTAHVASGVYDSAGGLTLYLDGAVVDAAGGTGRLSAHSDDVGLGNAADQARFAANHVVDEGKAGFRGTIAELAVQNVAMDGAELTALQSALLASELLV